MLPFLHVNIRGIKRQNYNKFSYRCNSLVFDSSVGTASILKLCGSQRRGKETAIEKHG